MRSPRLMTCCQLGFHHEEHSGDWRHVATGCELTHPLPSISVSFRHCAICVLYFSDPDLICLCRFCSNVLEDYELKALQSEHAAEQYAVRHTSNRKASSGWRDPKHKLQSEFSDTVHHVQDALHVFKERGVLHHTEYDSNIPAAVHGAPKTAEVILTCSERFLAELVAPSKPKMLV